MITTIVLELHDDILGDDAIIGELARKAVEKVKWNIHCANLSQWLAWEELDESITVRPYSDDMNWLAINLHDKGKIRNYTGCFEAPDKDMALAKAKNIFHFDSN